LLLLFLVNFIPNFLTSYMTTQQYVWLKNVIASQAKNIYIYMNTKRKTYNCIADNFFKHTVVLTVTTYWLTIQKHNRVSNFKIVIPYVFLLVQYGMCTCLKIQKLLMCGETLESAHPISLSIIESLLFWGSISVISGNRFLIVLTFWNQRFTFKF
jgi:hypothetical protein